MRFQIEGSNVCPFIGVRNEYLGSSNAVVMQHCSQLKSVVVLECSLQLLSVVESNCLCHVSQ